MGKENIEMTHKEYREFKKGVLGVKRFEVVGKRVCECPYLGKCDVLYENYVYCCSLKYKKCIQYLIEKSKEVNKRVKNQGHVNNDGINLNKVRGKCIINANEKHTLPSNKKDARVNYDVYNG